jgi:RNA polymerase sigma-70 factor (ECF subfamily)
MPQVTVSCAQEVRSRVELEQAYGRYRTFALYRIRCVVRQRAVAEEVLQESFLAALRRVASFDPEKGNMSTWFLTIARNQALDYLRSNTSRLSQNCLPLMRSDDRAGSDFLADLEARDRASLIRTAVKSLPKPQQTVIEMNFFGGLSGAEIALQLGEPSGTIKTRIRHALKMLRERLAQINFNANQLKRHED